MSTTNSTLLRPDLIDHARPAHFPHHCDYHRPHASLRYSLPTLSSLLILIPIRPLPLAAAPPPAHLHHTWAALPGFSCRSRKGGPARSGGPPFLESPGVKPNSGPEAGRRPVELLRTNAQRRTPRDQHRGEQACGGTNASRSRGRSRYVGSSSGAQSDGAAVRPYRDLDALGRTQAAFRRNPGEPPHRCRRSAPSSRTTAAQASTEFRDECQRSQELWHSEPRAIASSVWRLPRQPSRQSGVGLVLRTGRVRRQSPQDDLPTALRVRPFDGDGHCVRSRQRVDDRSRERRTVAAAAHRRLAVDCPSAVRNGIRYRIAVRGFHGERDTPRSPGAEFRDFLRAAPLFGKRPAQ